MRVFAALLRHGAYEQPPGVPSAHLPHPLTDEGRAHAHGAAARILELVRAQGCELHPTIDASPLLRAFETARLLAADLGAREGRAFEVESSRALVERGLGAAANLTMDEIARAVARDPRYPPLRAGWKHDPWFALPFDGAESLVEAGARAACWLRARLDDLAARAGRPVCKVFVGHGGAFRYAAVTLGALAIDDAPRLSMFHCRPVLLERQADGSYRHAAGAWKVRRHAAAPAGEDGPAAPAEGRR